MSVEMRGARSPSTRALSNTAKPNAATVASAPVPASPSKPLSTSSTPKVSSATTGALAVVSTVKGKAESTALTETQVKALTAAKINTMSKAELNALNVSYLTTSQIQGLSKAAIANLTSAQVSGFSKQQVQALSAAQVSALTVDQIGALTAPQIGALSNAQLAGMTSAQVASLLASKATAPSTDQIASFKSNQLSTTSLVGVSDGLQFRLVWDPQTSRAPQGFRNAVIAAAANLAATFSNRAVVNLQVGYGELRGVPLPSGAAAESASTGNSFSYSVVSKALKADAGNSTYQATADASLGDDPTKGASFFVSSALQKALGLKAATATGLDGYISLSSALPFQFSQTAVPGKYDAVGALEHEISEVMGRTGSAGAAYGKGVYTPLDLFRYTTKNGAATRSLTQNSSSYFSIDGGATNLGNYNASTGTDDYADWNASVKGDPFGFSVAGTREALTGNDAVEMTAIGWNLTSSGQSLSRFAKLYSLA